MLTELIAGTYVISGSILVEATFALAFNTSNLTTNEAIMNQLKIKVLKRGLDWIETLLNRTTGGAVGRDEVQEYFCQTYGTVAWDIFIEGLVPVIVDYYYNENKANQARIDLLAGLFLGVGALAFDYGTVGLNKYGKLIQCP
jgi:hypothetical protein